MLALVLFIYNEVVKHVIAVFCIQISAKSVIKFSTEEKMLLENSTWFLMELQKLKISYDIKVMYHRSPQWDSMDQATKDYLGYADEDNGEWWMTFQDFSRFFNDVTICTVGPDFDEDGTPTGDRSRNV